MPSLKNISTLYQYYESKTVGDNIFSQGCIKVFGRAIKPETVGIETKGVKCSYNNTRKQKKYIKNAEIEKIIYRNKKHIHKKKKDIKNKDKNL